MSDFPEFVSPTEILDHIQQVAAVRTDRVQHAIREMSNEQLSAINSLFASLMAEPDVRAAVSYWNGVLDVHLVEIRKVCPACGEDHDAEALADLVGDAKMPNHEQPSLFDEDMEPDPIRNIRENMAAWNVRLVDPDGPLNGPVECLGCGITNPSLEDRMLREPGVEGCGGCQQKAKWG